MARLPTEFQGPPLLGELLTYEQALSDVVPVWHIPAWRGISTTQFSAFSHSACPLRTPPSSPVLTWELWELHMESHGNEVSPAKHRYFPTLSQGMEKWMWMVYAVMNQAVWILQVKDIRCNSHVNIHMVPLSPQSHTSDRDATFCIPFIGENVLLGDFKGFKAIQKREEAQKNLQLKLCAWILNRVSEISQVLVAEGHALFTNAQNTTFPYGLINTSIFLP